MCKRTLSNNSLIEITNATGTFVSKAATFKESLQANLIEVMTQVKFKTRSQTVTTRSRSGLHLLWRNTAIHARKRTRQSYTTLSKLYLMPYLLSKQQHELSLTEAQRKLFKNDLDKKKISGLMISHAIVSSLPVSTDENSMPI